MAKSKDTAETPKAKKPKKIKQSNKLLSQCLVFIVITLLAGAGVIAGIFLTTAVEVQSLSTQNQTALASNSIKALIQQRFDGIQTQLNAIATSDDIYNALALDDDNERQALAETYRSQFQHAESLQLIPWSKLGTAGIKRKGITLRNNIETMLITRAGAKDTPAPEMYEINKQWVASFAAPIRDNDNVIGVALVSIKSTLFNDMFKPDSDMAQLGEITISRKGSNRNIFTTGVGNSQAATSTLPFDGGKLSLNLENKTNKAFTDAFNMIYAAIAAIVVLVSLLFLVLYRLVASSINNDSSNIHQYIQSLKGLHEPKKPTLNFAPLQKVVDPLVNLVGSGRSAIIDNDGEQSVQHGQTPNIGNAPTALEEVQESFAFECPEIFRDYDIRGLANTQLNDANAKLIGQAIGSEAASIKQKRIVLGYDARESSPRISAALIEGITSTGCNVISLGKVTTPMTYFASNHLETNAAIMVTGSHNGEDHNGIKIILNSKSLVGDEIQTLLSRIEKRDFLEGNGSVSNSEILDDYIEEIANDIITAKPMNVLIDTSSKSAADIAEKLLIQCDCEVKTFPTDSSLSQAEALKQLAAQVSNQGCDLAISFDSDADRLMAITNSGEIVSGDKLIMLFVKDIVTRNPGASVVYDVKCSRDLSTVITQSGGRPVMYKSGHSNIKAKMRECDAIFGGELTGHFYFKERWFGFDDGIYSALRLVELLSASEQSFDERLSELPHSFASEEIIIPVEKEDDKYNIVNFISESLAEESGEKITTDGFRIEFDSCWGLVRPSNTSKAITLRFEAESEELLATIKELFKTALSKANADLSIPF